MNKEYKTIEDKLIVTDQYGCKTERSITNNFKEILITENNIEEIQNLLIDEEIDKKKNIEQIKKNGTYKFIIAGIFSLSFVLHIIIKNFLSAFSRTILVSFWITYGVDSIKPYLKEIKANKKSITVLEEYLTEEKESLKELNNEKKNDLDCLNQLSGTLSTSEKIETLKRKLYVIDRYENDKKYFRKLYENGNFQYALAYLLNKEDLEFMEELIKNDLENKPIIKKTKDKTLKLKK